MTSATSRRRPWVRALVAAAIAAPLTAAVVLLLMLWLVHLWNLPPWLVVSVSSAAGLLGSGIAARRQWRSAGRPLRFTLRRLLIATAVVAVLMGTIGQMVLRRTLAFRDLARSGVLVEDYVSANDDWLKRRLGFDPFEIEAVRVYGPDGVEALLRHVNTLDFLTHIAFEDPARDDALVGVTELRRLPNLNSAAIYSTGVTDDALDAFAGWDSLHHLFLNGPRVTDAGLEKLGSLTQLRTLTVMSELNKPPLAVTDSGLASLSDLKKLWQLRIVNAPITDASVPVLSEFKRLEHLSLYGTAITDAGREELCRALPRCRVHTRRHQFWSPLQVEAVSVVDGAAADDETRRITDHARITALIEFLEQWSQRTTSSLPLGPNAGNKRGVWFRFEVARPDPAQYGLSGSQFLDRGNATQTSIAPADEATLRELLQ